MEILRDQAITRAAERMKTSIPFFPPGPYAIGEVLSAMDRMCGTPEQIDWLASKAINSWPGWKGIAGLRELYCSRFKPRDGIEPEDEYSPELAARAHEGRSTDAKIAAWKEELRLLPEGERPARQEVIEIWEGVHREVKKLT